MRRDYRLVEYRSRSLLLHVASRVGPWEGVARRRPRSLLGLRRVAPLLVLLLDCGLLLRDHGVNLLARPDQARIVLLLDLVADVVQCHQCARAVDVVLRLLRAAAHVSMVCP